MSLVLAGSKRNARKSRNGCFNCKARKVKCSEALPACESCLARELYCIYPSKAQRRNDIAIHRRHTHSSNNANPRFIQTPATPSLSSFKTADFHYFHHFLTAAYPSLPYGNDSVWTLNVPQLAHYYQPLLHAILSLGASHLALLSPRPEYMTDAVLHRGLALTGLREILAKDHYTKTELDVLLAICYSLTSQSAYMADCQADFASMIRGCALITEQIAIRGLWSSTAFSLDPTAHIQNMLEQLSLSPGLDRQPLQEGIGELEALSNLLETVSHRRFHRALVETLQSLQRSGAEAYTSFHKIYAVLYTMSEATFQEFIASENSLTQIIFVYFASVMVLMLPYLSYEVPQRLSVHHTFACTCKWLDSIHRRLPIALRGYIKWPFGIIKAFQHNHQAFGQDVFGLIRWTLLAAASDKAGSA